MITFSYLASAVVGAVLGVLLLGGSLDEWSFIALVGGDVLPRLGRRELGLPDGQRDLPDGDARARDRVLLRGRHRGRRHHGPAAVRQPDRLRTGCEVATGFFIGAAVMALGGIAEMFFGVRAEQRSLEDIAEPLSATSGDAEPGGAAAPTAQRASGGPGGSGSRPLPAAPLRPVTGLRRYRPGVGSSRSYAPWMSVSPDTDSARDLQREVDVIVRIAARAGRTRPRGARDRCARAPLGPGPPARRPARGRRPRRGAAPSPAAATPPPGRRRLPEPRRHDPGIPDDVYDRAVGRLAGKSIVVTGGSSGPRPRDGAALRERGRPRRRRRRARGAPRGRPPDRRVDRRGAAATVSSSRPMPRARRRSTALCAPPSSARDGST